MNYRTLQSFFLTVFVAIVLIGCGGNDGKVTLPIYTIGGNVSNLTGTIVIQLNSRETLTIEEDGVFAFPETYRNGVDYEITILDHPNNNTCKITNNEGVVDGHDITDIDITCQYPAVPILQLTTSFKQLAFSWSELSSEDSYQLFENPDGASGFSIIEEDFSQESINREVSVHKLDWPNALYFIQACRTDLCSIPSNQVATLDQEISAIGYLKASNPEEGDRFGSAIAISGDGTTLAVSSPFESNETNTTYASGAVYIFEHDGNEWSPTPQLFRLSSPVEGDQFGYSLALSENGNTLAVGTPGDGQNGAIYVYTRSSGVWNTTPELIKPAGLSAGDRFGTSVSFNTTGSAHTLAIGTPHDSSDSNTWSGAVYIFTRDTGPWTQHSYLKANDAAALDLFGHALALNGDASVLAIGAKHKASDNNPDTPQDKARSGATYVYTLDSNTWTQQAYIKPAIHNTDDAFGHTLDINEAGTLLAVGAPNESSDSTGINGEANDDSAPGSGAVYLFQTVDNTWEQTHYFKSSNSNAGDNFGHALALNAIGDELIVTAEGEANSATGINSDESDNAYSAAGASYFFQLIDDEWEQITYIKPTNTDEGDRFGHALGLDSSGDTLAISAIGEASENDENKGYSVLLDNDAPEAGAVYLY